MKTAKKLTNVRLSDDLIQDLKEVSEQTELSQSQIIREAIKEKVAALKETLNEPDLAVVE
jgi:predicted DNA-binding protein